MVEGEGHWTPDNRALGRVKAHGFLGGCSEMMGGVEILAGFGWVKVETVRSNHDTLPNPLFHQREFMPHLMGAAVQRLPHGSASGWKLSLLKAFDSFGCGIESYAWRRLVG